MMIKKMNLQKNLKILLLSLILLIFTGCDIKYSVSFSKNSFINDNINVTNAVIKANNELMISPVNLIFQNNFYNVTYPSKSSFNASQQWKNIDEYLKYSILPRTFSSLVKFTKKGNKVSIEFKYDEDLKNQLELYGNIENLSVSLYIPYYVSSHNATSVKDSTYTWVINDIEKANIKIKFDMDKSKNFGWTIFSICTIVIVLGIIVATIVSFAIRNKRNNEI